MHGLVTCVCALQCSAGPYLDALAACRWRLSDQARAKVGAWPVTKWPSVDASSLSVLNGHLSLHATSQRGLGADQLALKPKHLALQIRRLANKPASGGSELSKL
jgi:hypothetical protein